jgi:DNA-binding response OmpR family regulator
MDRQGFDDGDSRGQGLSAKALVVISEDRVALATVLVLQELDLAVDIAIDGPAAVVWARRAGYELIVCGPGGHEATDLALAFRVAAPDARIVLLTAPGSLTDALDAFAIEVIRPPLDVNTLVHRLWAAAA